MTSETGSQGGVCFATDRLFFANYLNITTDYMAKYAQDSLRDLPLEECKADE